MRDGARARCGWRVCVAGVYFVSQDSVFFFLWEFCGIDMFF